MGENEQNIIERLTAVEQRSKSNTHQIAEVKRQTDALTDLAKSVALMAQEQRHQGEKLDEVVSDVKALKEVPGKKWDELWKNIMGALVAALVGAALVYLGLK